MKKTQLFFLILFSGLGLMVSAQRFQSPTILRLQVTTHSVTISGTAAPPPAIAYNAKRATVSGGPYILLAANLPSVNYVDTQVTAGTQYFYVFTSLDAALRESVPSNEASATIPGTPPPPPPPPPPPCTTVTANTWYTSAFTSQTGQFSVDYDAIPSSATMDAITGLSKGTPTAFTSVGPIVWFSNTGTVQARNGGAYTAAASYRYSANVTYHVRMTVNLTTHTYSAYVHTGTAAETQIANNYAFRTEQAAVTPLDHFGAFVNAGTPSFQVCNFVLNSAPPPPPPPPPPATFGPGTCTAVNSVLSCSVPYSNMPTPTTSTATFIANGVTVTVTTPLK